MKCLGLDIKDHEVRSIQDIDTDEFQFVVVLDKSLRRVLTGRHAIPESKILNVFVDDPYGDDFVQYVRCAGRINRGLNSLEFSN